MDDFTAEFKRYITEYEEGFITAQEFAAKMLEEAAIQHHRASSETV